MIFTANRSQVPTRMRRYLVLSLTVVLVAGCGSRKEVPVRDVSASSGSATNLVPGLIVGANEKSFDEMLPEDVLVSVNGVTLKRGDCDEILNRMERTFLVAHPSTRKTDVVSYRKNKAKSLVGQFLAKQLLLQEARRRNLTPTPESKAKMAEVLVKRAKLEKKNPEAYLRSLGTQEAAVIRTDLDEQALILSLRQNEFGDRLKVTDEDLQKARDRVAGYNRMCEATNAFVKARGIAICERLRKGEDFAAVANGANEYQDGDGGGGGYWGEFVRGEIDDAAVRSAAFTLPVGAVSDPIDTEEGLVIIKVIERKGVDSPIAKASATVKLGRIVLRLGETKTLADEATLRKELERNRLEQLQSGWFASLRQQAHIEYPNGTNFWKKAVGK